MCDLDVMDTSSKLSVIRKAAALVRARATQLEIVSSHQVYLVPLCVYLGAEQKKAKAEGIKLPLNMF